MFLLPSKLMRTPQSKTGAGAVISEPPPKIGPAVIVATVEAKFGQRVGAAQFHWLKRFDRFFLLVNMHDAAPFKSRKPAIAGTYVREPALSIAEDQSDGF